MEVLPRILLFDSGVGGLSIYHKIKKSLPKANYHYYADHMASPYGDKDDEWLDHRINRILIQLDQALTPDIIVLACNTASTLSLESLRSNITTDIVGVVPAIKTASEKYQAETIGLLATPATIEREYIENLTNKYSSNKTIIKVGSTELVALAEEKLHGGEIPDTSLHRIITPFIDANCKHVVLGCTHFPLLKPELQALAPNIHWIDSGEAIANRVQHRLGLSVNSGSEVMKEQPEIIGSNFYSSAEITDKLQTYIKGIGFSKVKSHYLPCI